MDYEEKLRLSEKIQPYNQYDGSDSMKWPLVVIGLFLGSLAAVGLLLWGIASLLLDLLK